jgi:membrane protein
MFYLLYKFMPNRKIQTKIAFFGALSAGFLWELAKQGFRLYFFNVVDLNKFYGSFGLLLALVLWVYYSCIVFILGAEVGLIWQSRSPDGEGPEASF